LFANKNNSCDYILSQHHDSQVGVSRLPSAILKKRRCKNTKVYSIYWLRQKRNPNSRADVDF